MEIPDFLLAEFQRMATPERSHLIQPETELAYLRMDVADKLSLACTIDETLLTEITDAEMEGWRTIGDVVESAIRRGGAAAP